MRNFQFRFILSIVILYSVMIMAMPVSAAPVRLNQVVQVVNAKPGKAATGDFSQLRLANDFFITDDDDDDDDKTTDTPAPQQDDRVITTTRTEIVEEADCNCEPVEKGGGFPYWVLGFAAIPLLFLIPDDDDPDRTPTPPPTTTPTPPTTATPTPPMTPTPTPPTTPTPTPTPPMTPTPTPPMTPTPTPPEPVPEPMTLLLFGTGLASIGLAARKKFGKKGKTSTEN